MPGFTFSEPCRSGQGERKDRSGWKLLPWGCCAGQASALPSTPTPHPPTAVLKELSSGFWKPGCSPLSGFFVYFHIAMPFLSRVIDSCPHEASSWESMNITDGRAGQPDSHTTLQRLPTSSVPAQSNMIDRPSGGKLEVYSASLIVG